MAITSPATKLKPPSEGARAPKLIDCDVHPIVAGGVTSLYPYMPAAWAERLRMKGANIFGGHQYMRYAHPTGHVIRADSEPAKGQVGGSDPDYLRKDLLDRYGIDYCILVGQQVKNVVTMQSQADESVVLASAFNDFFVNEWLPRDPRFRYAIGVTPQAPEAAATEVRRLGRHDGIVAVDLPLLNILLGDRYYHPIFQAAVECGLPVILHVSGTEGKFQGSPTYAGGNPGGYLERNAAGVEIAIATLDSLVLSGVFERFKDLRVVFVEWGFGWVVPQLWSLDKKWRELRMEAPWVRRPPSEYVQEHVRFTTQPTDEPQDPSIMLRMIEDYLSHILMYSSDYPHWDNDLPGTVLQQLRPETQTRVFAQNAAELFQL